MDKLFELSAQLTVDTAAFLTGLAQAEQAAARTAAALVRMQSTASVAWQGMTAAIQGAAAAMREFLALSLRQPGESKTLAAPQPTKSSAPRADVPRPAPVPVRIPAFTPAAVSPPVLQQQSRAALSTLETAHRSTLPESSADLSSLARSVAEALNGASVQLDGETVGRLITPAVSRNIAQDAARRYVL